MLSFLCNRYVGWACLFFVVVKFVGVKYYPLFLLCYFSISITRITILAAKYVYRFSFYVCLFCCYWFMFSSVIIPFVGICIISFIDLWLCKRQWYIYCVSGNRKFVRYNQLRDNFRGYARHLEMPDFVYGEHRILAAERRFAEEFVTNVVLQPGELLRDVGGSRTRHRALGERRHICSPILDAADIYREDKDEQMLFTNCKQQGGSCPVGDLSDIHMLSHVDYFCSKDELCKIVRGPTFIINHDFTKFEELGQLRLPGNAGLPAWLDGPGGAAARGDARRDNNGDWLLCEAKAKIHGGQVTMEPMGGTPYGPHPFHNWKNEGCVVSRSGAFVYTRLGYIGTTQVIFCYPANGMYSSMDIRNLGKDDAVFQWAGGSVAKSGVNYHFGGPDGIDCIPRYVIDGSALMAASSDQSSKYFHQVRSYVMAKMSQLDIKPINLELVIRYVLYEGDRHRLYTLLDSHLNLPAGYADSVLYVWMVRYLRKYLHIIMQFDIGQCIIDNYLIKQWLWQKYIIPWSWRSFNISAYRFEYDPNRVDVRHLPNSDRPFRNERSRFDAGAYGRCNCCAGQDVNEYDRWVRDQGDDARNPAQPAANQPAPNANNGANNNNRPQPQPRARDNERPEDPNGLWADDDPGIEPDDGGGQEIRVDAGHNEDVAGDIHEESDQEDGDGRRWDYISHIEHPGRNGAIRRYVLEEEERDDQITHLRILLPNGNYVNCWPQIPRYVCRDTQFHNGVLRRVAETREPLTWRLLQRFCTQQDDEIQGIADGARDRVIHQDRGDAVVRGRGRGRPIRGMGQAVRGRPPRAANRR